MVLYFKEVKYTEDLLILGIMDLLEVDLKIMLKMHGEKDLYKKEIIVMN